MPRLGLGSPYKSTSRIAGAQRSVNVYSEMNAQGAAAGDFSLYPRPGLTPLSPCPQPGPGRCLYTASNGDLYAVVGQNLWYINRDWIWHGAGALGTIGTAPVYIADNGKDGIVVDGSTYGLDLNLSTRTASHITDANFLGGTRVTFLNFFLLLNELASPNFYSTNPTAVTFNALAFGSLTQFPGNVVGLIASEGALWIFGPYKGEVWADAGTFPFAFQSLSGIIIEHGLAGPYALARYDVNIYWLAQSPEGNRLIVQGVGNAAKRVSTHAIEEMLLGYEIVNDCIITAQQIRGHPFIYFDFPTQDVTLVYDESTQEWHEEAFYDVNGVQHRTKDTFKTLAYDKNVSLDWNTGQLYLKDINNYSDNGIPCVYLRDFPHVVDQEENRVAIWRLIADMVNADAPGLAGPVTLRPWSAGFNPGFGPSVLQEPPLMTLFVSHDRGYTFYAHSDQLMSGRYGYNTRPTFWRIGIGFDTVLRFQWTGPFKSAMNSPFVTFEVSDADA